MIGKSSDAIELAGRSSWQDVKHVRRLVFSRGQRFLIHSAVFLIFALVIAAFLPWFPTGSLALAVCMLLYFVMPSWIQYRHFIKRQASRGDDQIVIDGDGVIVRALVQNMHFAWDAFESVTRDDRFIVLRGRDRGRLPIIILPKSWCVTESDWMRVEELVANGVPPVVSRYTSEEARQIRNDRLPAEYALQRSVLLLLAVSLVIALVAFVVDFDVTSAEESWYVVLFRVQAALFAAACGLTAWSARRLAAWSRLPLLVFAFLSVSLFPIGTFLGLKILHLLATGPEPRLLTREYEQLVRIAGPMRVQKSRSIRPFTWVVIGLVALIIILVGLISLIPEEIRHNL